MPKVWILVGNGEDLIGVCSPDQGSVVSLLHDKGHLIDSTLFRGETLLHYYGPDYIDEIAALPEREFFNLMGRIDVDIIERDYYGKQPLRYV